MIEVLDLKSYWLYFSSSTICNTLRFYQRIKRTLFLMSLVVISWLLVFLIFLISVQMGCMFKDSLSCGIFRHSNTTAWFQPSTLFYGPTFLGLQLQRRPPSPLASPDLYKRQDKAALSDILCLQNQYHLRDIYTFPSSPAITMYTLGLL